jgi:hypothetical protein
MAHYHLTRHFSIVGYLFLLCLFPTQIFGQQKKGSAPPIAPENEEEIHIKRNEYELSRLRDPGTGNIPSNIREKELTFSSQIPTKEGLIHSEHLKNHNFLTQSVNWISRGPSNIGGRTYALAIDVSNENIILAGSTTGGMYRSTDRGSTWVRTTSVNDLPSVRSLVQDTRPGKTNTWYYGTGEMYGNTGGYPLWLNINTGLFGEYYGNGISKSTDDGKTWFKLASTATQDSTSFIQPFNFIHQLAIDPSDSIHDIVYGATAGGIERSSDGGTTWTMVLGDAKTGPSYTDVCVTAEGVVYAELSNLSVQQTYGNLYGVYKSTDGIHWVNITPHDWQTESADLSMAIAPSNKNIVYVSSSSRAGCNLWKYTSGANDTSGVWENRSSSITSTGVNYIYYIKVKPDDENSVFLGEVSLWISTDGFKTPDNISDISLYNGYSVIHADHETICFFPTNPSSALIGCDGGVYMTPHLQSQNISWASLDNNFLTAQFYTIAIDHSNENDIIIGGMQDNSTAFTNTVDETAQWSYLFGGDGSYCAMSFDRGSYYVSSQWGFIYREVVDDYGDILGSTRVDPPGGTGYLFINPFILDPNNTDMMYLAGGSYLWRNSDLTMIPMGSNDPSNVNWTLLTQTRLPANGPYGSSVAISSVGVSTVPANIVYYGSNDGQVYRLDSANIGNPEPINIWKGKGFPSQAFVSCIAVDPHNASNAIVAFANYNVQSLFYTSDGGSTWTPIGGNLEEHPDGTGNGPSFRWASILHVSNGIVYLVGTSTGLYSTSVLNGMSTVWELEGATTIGNNIVNMMDVRESDGEVAVATCGNGVFTANITSIASGVIQHSPSSAESISSVASNPNPFQKETTLEFTLNRTGYTTIAIYDELGSLVWGDGRGSSLEAGVHSVQIDGAKLPSGSLYARITSGLGDVNTVKLVHEK